MQIQIQISFSCQMGQFWKKTHFFGSVFHQISTNARQSLWNVPRTLNASTSLDPICVPVNLVTMVMEVNMADVQVRGADQFNFVFIVYI